VGHRTVILSSVNLGLITIKNLEQKPNLLYLLITRREMTPTLTLVVLGHYNLPIPPFTVPFPPKVRNILGPKQFPLSGWQM
jgi:hypothetical protein